MAKKQRLSTEQFNRLSEILGNISVAWFTVGVISPLFVPFQSLLDFITTFGLSLFMSLSFVVLSLAYVRKAK